MGMRLSQEMCGRGLGFQGNRERALTVWLGSDSSEML